MTLETMVNGRYTRAVDCSDRGFQYGDGVFTTMPFKAGTLLYLDRHIARLGRDSSRLNIDFPYDDIVRDTGMLADRWRDGILKIQVTRGSGGRGYRVPEVSRSTRVLSVHPAVPLDPRLIADGAAVRICRHRLGCNEALAGIKHMNRLEQILARAEWDDPDTFEGLMLDQDGNLIEGTMSNVLLVHRGTLSTPLLDRCGVAGVMRTLVLEWAMHLGITLHQRRIRPSELGAADEIFLTNSVIGVVPVRSIDTRKYVAGSVARQLRRQVEEAETVAGENQI